MKLPRDLKGTDLARALQVLGYEITRQKGSHMRITTTLNGTHHEVIPAINQSSPAPWLPF